MVAFNDDWEFDAKELYGEYSSKDPDRKFDGLYRSVEAAYRGLEPFRNLNRKLVREYAGPAYGECETKRKYLNMTNQLVEAYTMLLAANRPKAEISTRHSSLRGYAKHFEIGINNLITEIGLEFTIRRWILDAFFTAGIIKVHQKDSGEIQFEKNLWMDPGTPYASNVSLDNFVYDASATSWGELKWAGDMYRIPFDDVKAGVEIGMYDPEVAKEIKPTSKFYTDKTRLEEFSKGNETDLDDHTPMVDLCDIWVKRDHKIYTFVVTDRNKFCIKHEKPLAVMDWLDPEFGPYHILGFSEVPENIMPVGPAVHMDELDRLINNVLRKQARRAMRQKEAQVFDGADAVTAKRWQRASDGELFQGNAQSIGRLVDGGADPNSMLFLGNIIEMYKNACGGLDIIRGTGAAAGTVGQEQLIQDASNRSIAQMQYRVLDATRRLLRCLSFMLWNDEVKEIAGQIEVGGFTADATWRPGDREGNFIDYNLDINVYSMTYRPPAQRAEAIVQYVERVVLPLMPFIQQQGGVIDVPALNETMADLTGMDEYSRIVTFSLPPEGEEGSPTTSIKPSRTSRTYNRSIPSGTAQGAATVMQQQWAAAGNSGAGGAQPAPVG